MLHMDRSERWFKAGLDLVLTTLLAPLLKYLTGSWTALIIAWALAHTINFFFNGQLWGALKHFGLVRVTPGAFARYRRSLVQRVESEPSILFAAAYGSLCRGQLRASSDLDIRLVRAPGVANGLRASLFVMKERTRALFQRFPLDLYVFDTMSSLSRLNPLEGAVPLKQTHVGT
jgi:predicted nucleotidyltransferase